MEYEAELLWTVLWFVLVPLVLVSLCLCYKLCVPEHFSTPMHIA